jgi:pentatricopeptide repeat protein
MPKIRRVSAPFILPLADPSAARQQGLRAFQNGRFDEAIRLWSPLAEQDGEARLALAEAHFRRSLKAPGEAGLADLRQAAALAPADQRYQYHLGMRLHQAGDRAGAITCYRGVVERGGPRGAALLLALATLEGDLLADLAALPGSTPEIRAVLAPAQALLAGQPWPPPGAQEESGPIRAALGFGQSASEALLSLWRGLGAIAAGQDAAATLDDQRPLPHQRLVAIRRAYQGVAAAHAGDTDRALRLWQQTYEGGIVTAALLDNLAAALYERLAVLLDAGDLAGAAGLALQTVSMPLGGGALDELRVRALDGAAHAAAASGDWGRGAELWEAARQVVAGGAGLGSPRPLLRNLALAYEAQERWVEAAEAWRAMLRTRPRKKGGDQADAVPEAQWAWVRARVIECYKRAGRPDEAVTVFRQMIKAEPDDLGLRLQLVDALLANEQEQAAFNEVERILAIDPHFVDAQLRRSALLSARGAHRDAEQILRDVMRRDPDREDVRRQLARSLLAHAGLYIGHGRDAAAVSLLREGLELEPDNEQFPLSLARAFFNLGKRDEARAQLDAVLAMAGERLEPYLNVFQCWVFEEDADEARAVVARAEATFAPPPELYAQLGTIAIGEDAPPPEQSPFDFMLAPRRPPAKPADTPLSRLGRELVERAFALRPQDAQLRLMTARALLGSRPDLALAYADEAVRCAPDDANMLILRGIALAVNRRKREAKDQLRKAAALARKRGDAALADEADGIRREIDSPFFHLAFQMRSLLDDAGLDLDDLL